MRSPARTHWLIVALLTLCLIATAAPVSGGGQKGSKKKPPPSEETVPVLKFLIHDTGSLQAQLLNDHDPEVPYVDHRISGPGDILDPCVTGWVNSRGGTFTYLYKGSSDPDHPLFADCHSQVENDPDLQPLGYRGPRTYVLRLPADPLYGDCCTPLGLDVDAEGYCTLPVENEAEFDYGSQRIRTGNLFWKKIRPVDLDFLFNHRVGEERPSFELQSEGELPVGGSGDYRFISTNTQDTFRIVELGGPTICSGFPFLLYIEFWRVEVPEGG